MRTFAQFVQENQPPVGNGVRYWSHWIHEDHISYTPFVEENSPAGGHYDESRKVVVSFPEKVVRLPIPPWAIPLADDFGQASIESIQMFTSEAQAMAQVYLELLQREAGY